MKATLIIEDRADNRVDIKLTWDPPLNGNTRTTAASDLAIRLLDTAMEWYKEHRSPGADFTVNDLGQITEEGGTVAT